jgi:ATP-binding cassette subfamily C protein/ATP-binding cassette subfamily C protein EexD
MEEGEPDKVVAAAQMAGVHDMVLQLPNGYESEIGEQGALLSGGQRQRIGLARALYGSPVLLVLDEPNANLDSTGEEALTGAILAAKTQGTTIVLVAHRPVMMTHVDKIAVLNGGQIQMCGSRDEVLAQMRPRAVPRLEEVLAQARPRAVPQTGQPPVRVVAQ